MENKLIFLDRNDPEFTKAFNNFADKEMYNPTYGERLQYMGTVIEANGSIAHQFRHRALPSTNQRKYWQFEASQDFKIKYIRSLADSSKVFSKDADI